MLHLVHSSRHRENHKGPKPQRSAGAHHVYIYATINHWLTAKLPGKNITAEIHLTTQRVCVWSRPVAEQLVLERRGSATDVHVRDGFDEERPLGDAEALHPAPSLVLLAQQQPQLAVAVQVDVGASGVRRGFDADGEAGGGRGDDVGSEINDDGPGGVEPLQGALRAAQIHLLHVPGVAFVHQTAERTERKDMSRILSKAKLIQSREVLNVGKDLRPTMRT